MSENLKFLCNFNCWVKYKTEQLKDKLFNFRWNSKKTMTKYVGFMN
jgi:hypothetical protein